MRTRSFLEYVLAFTALVFIASQAISQNAQRGDWIYTGLPSAMLFPGEVAGDFALSIDGVGAFRGRELFPPQAEPSKTRLFIYRSPGEEMSLVFRFDDDFVVGQVYLVDHIADQIVAHRVPLGANGARPRAAASPSWSPDGRLVAFPFSRALNQNDLVILARNGEHVIHFPDDVGQGNTTSVNMGSLRTEDPDWISVSYNIMTCPPRCNTARITGTVGAGHRLMFSPDVWATRPAPAAPAPVASPVLGLDAQVPSAAAPSAALNDARIAIVEDLLADYDGDVERIRTVAANADYGILAWAAYGDNGAMELAQSRGWTPMQSIAVENRVTGTTVAQLFVSDAQEQVLAFRGSVDGWDFVTNVGGSISTSELLLEQVSSALEIAEQIATLHPEVTFVGHSLGGRLAQVARLETGRPAVIFNSAPLGRSEIQSILLRRVVDALLRREREDVPILSFNGPDDRISRSVLEDSIEVSNIVIPEYATGLAELNILRSSAIFLSNQALISHTSEALAKAMLYARIAVDEGWLDAYIGQTDPSSQPTDAALRPADTGHADIWGPEIVYNGRENVFMVCGYSEAEKRACLPSIGMTERGIDFLLHFSRNAVAREYLELGNVDLVYAEADRGAQAIALVNGDPDIFEVRTHYDDARNLFEDRVSQFLLNRYPYFYGGSITRLTGHRDLPNGGQRFVFATDMPDGCRACPAIGSAVVYYDFDQQGRFLGSRPIGIWGPSLFNLPHGARFSDARSNVALLQFHLNALGYDAGGMDGLIGEQTRVALRGFQTDNCLPATGELDRITSERLANASSISSPCQDGNVQSTIGATQASATTLPLTEGRYAREGVSCDTPGDGFRAFRNNELHFHESSCSIVNFSANGTEHQILTECSGEGETWQTTRIFVITSSTSYLEDGSRYNYCGQ